MLSEMMSAFSARSTEPELMDSGDVAAHDIEEALDDLERVNRFLGGYGPSIAGVATLLDGHGYRPLNILDVGTGSADFPRVLAGWARRRGLSPQIEAIDACAVTVAHARRRCRNYPGITVRHQNLFELDARPGHDIVHAALMLHHLEDTVAIKGLRKMYDLSRLGVVLNDLHRHPVAYWGSHALLSLVARNHVARHDGPVSVRRAFTRQELRDLVQRGGLPEPVITWHPLFRWQVLIRKEP